MRAEELSHAKSLVQKMCVVLVPILDDARPYLVALEGVAAGILVSVHQHCYVASVIRRSALLRQGDILQDIQKTAKQKCSYMSNIKRKRKDSAAKKVEKIMQ